MLTCCAPAQVCKGGMRELVLHVPVNVGRYMNSRAVSLPPCTGTCGPPRQWLLQPVPPGIRIRHLTLCGRHCAACPAGAAMPRDVFLMQTSQLQNVQSLLLQDAQCPAFPPMPRLTHLRTSWEPAATQTWLPLPIPPMLEALTLEGVSSCPNSSCLSGLTRLSLTGRHLSGPPVSPASADILQVIKVCPACPSLFLCTDAVA